MKIARVIPLFKSGDNNLFTNYRQVSVLPIFSKLLERVVYNRLIKYFDKYDILFNYQFGFSKNHSTSLALLNLLDKITSAIDQKKYTIGIFLDLSKAFDTVNHAILLKTMNQRLKTINQSLKTMNQCLISINQSLKIMNQ